MRELRTSLKELRMEAGFTQSELAEIVGNCRDNISRLVHKWQEKSLLYQPFCMFSPQLYRMFSEWTQRKR